MNTFVIRALAKVNLAIDVLRKRPDGYHEIDMVTIPLKLHDSVEITPVSHRPNAVTHLYCDDPTIVCDESNLAYKALEAMKTNFHVQGAFEMLIHKRIPVQAGLGGGSADAAAVMKALNAFVSEKTENIENKVALTIGADVPFCLYNRPSRVRGIGEILEPIPIAKPYHVLIVKPNIGLSTKAVYEAYDAVADSVTHPNIPALIQALAEDDEINIQKNMINVLSVPAIKEVPLIASLLQDMNQLGLLLSGMSGTGSACFALHKEKKMLEKAMAVFQKKGYDCFLTEFALEE